METSCKTAVGAAVAGGYVLGRTKKAKLALGLVMFVAGRRLSPAELAAAGMRQLAENPQLAGLRDQVRDELPAAVKSAASEAMGRQVSSLAGSLHDRTGALSGLGGAEDAEEDRDGQDEEEAHAENEEPEQDESEEDESEEDESDKDESDKDEPEKGKQHAARDRRGTRSGGTAARARKTSKKEPAKRAPAKRAPAKRAASKSASQPTAKKADSKRRSGSRGGR